MTEFSVIETFFKPLQGKPQNVELGIGDDCAVVSVPPSAEMAISMDTLVEGVHFFSDVDPADLGYKALAVNLSDLAAMGAKPKWFTLSLTLPKEDPAWLKAFSHGMQELINQYPIQLIGGDTTRGPLSITIQVHGWLPKGQRITRAGAKVGDKIYVSGQLGDAALALQAKLKKVVLPPKNHDVVMSRFNRPEPRLPLGNALLTSASSMLDVSDGLVADLGHICECSGVGAELYCERLPLSSAVNNHVELMDDYALPLTGGDDYELCFTIPPSAVDDCLSKIKNQSVGITEIGRIVEGDQVECLLNGRHIHLDLAGFQHF